ncbi:cytochrome c3-like protein [Ancylomarina subtilis]|uniref:Cytochrome c3-like protein n=1 Tax=Ancylomarina subtilis TaxID=1639035 RepID=A0A4Q7VLU7_9BACT|nr:cytochrome c3 family protein [Ancylomarina subtilis]RZT97232.1 cytochrome c3-like protein [Ancylomarina subtilis]
MRFSQQRISLLVFFLVSFTLNLKADNDCLRCHANQTHTIYNDWTERNEKRLMNPYFILDSLRMKAGVHRSFVCTDCHSSDYETYPHNGELKLEPLSTCIDCHGGDENFADYKFELIEEEFQKSTHARALGEQFTCSKCHSQHYYQAKARTSENVRDIVKFSNEMCMSCHDNTPRYQLMSDSVNPKLVETHNWLPNQKLHFESVRCIECHTQVKDSLMISHNILPKEKALKLCVECHTANSHLNASLYKYKNIQARTKKGKLGIILSNKSYVIGAYQNDILNLLSILIFMAIIAGVIVHSFFRIIKK